MNLKINNKNQSYFLYLKFESPILNHIITNNFILIGGNDYIYYYDYINNKFDKNNFSLNSELEFIVILTTIHDQLFFASTNIGNI